jgi:hypothetical protein
MGFDGGNAGHEKSLNIINYGKPFPVQYRFAEQLLLQNTINKPRKENKNEKD